MHVTHLERQVPARNSEGGGESEVTPQGKACQHTEDKKNHYATENQREMAAATYARRRSGLRSNSEES
jgi:hypothetical protein